MAVLSPLKGQKEPASAEPISFIDLMAQQALIRDKIDTAIARVLDHGGYIMGPEVAALEQNLSSFCGAKHTISCASGTDALLIVLMAKNIGPGDAVICPAFTYTATPEVIALLGATPVFADVSADTFNLDPQSLPGAIDAAKRAGLKPRAVIAVDLFGHPANYDKILPFAEAHGLFVLSDSAQGFGGELNGRKTGTFGLATATSFFPAKPLGCYGDGGAIFTDDDELAKIMRSIRLHGQGASKYDCARVGINGRLDTIQAAILIEKLKIFPDEIRARQIVADRYSKAFSGLFAVPAVSPAGKSVWAQYTLRLPSGIRDALSIWLSDLGVPTQIYYPKPLHHQPAYANSVVASGGVPVSERLPKEVLSLPMHPYLTEAVQRRIIDAVTSFDAKKV